MVPQVVTSAPVAAERNRSLARAFGCIDCIERWCCYRPQRWNDQLQRQRSGAKSYVDLMGPLVNFTNTRVATTGW
jgi:hypothetical protein